MSLNADNLVSKVARVSLSERVSQKSSVTYVVMTIHFMNGLQIENFVDKRDWYGLQDVINNKTSDNNADHLLDRSN